MALLGTFDDMLLLFLEPHARPPEANSDSLTLADFLHSTPLGL